MTTFDETEQPLTTNDIVNVEQNLDIIFPTDCREHYLRYNGGMPSLFCFLTDDGMWLMVQEFLSIRYGTNTLEYTYKTLTTNDTPIPNYLVPFASESGGNYFCFSFRNSDNGAIYYYDGEHYDNPERAFTKISDSLNNFLDSLQEEPEEF